MPGPSGPAKGLVLFGVILAACEQGNPVTGPGTPDQDRTSPYTQSETSIAIAQAFLFRNVVVAYNDETDPDGKIFYDTSTRRVYQGASMMGWSYSIDEGASWTYGGRVPTPPGIAVLWSDPATTTLTGAPTQVVYRGTLAISTDFFPSSGYIEGDIDNSIDWIDGACIARSDDGGVHFAIHQCVRRNTCHTDHSTSTGVPCGGAVGGECPGGQFCRGDYYDGGNMAASPDGRVYYAVRSTTFP